MLSAGLFQSAPALARQADEAANDGSALLDMLYSARLYTEPRLSPSGRYLAYFRLGEEDGDPDILVVRDLDAPEDVSDPRTALPLGPVDAYDLRWAHEDRLLVTVSRAARNNDSFRMTTTFSVGRDLSMPLIPLPGHYGARGYLTVADIVDMLPDDPDHILMPNYRDRDYDLFRVNIMTGARELVERGTPSTVGWRSVNGVPVVRTDLFYDRVRYRTRSSAEDDWEYTAEVRRGELINREVDFEWAGSTGEPGVIYVRARPEGHEFVGIHRYDLETGDFLETIAERDDFDIAASMTNTTSGVYLGHAYVGDRLVFEFLDQRFQTHYNALLGFFGDQMVVNPRSIAGDRMVLRVDGPNEVGSVYLYDVAAQSVDPVFSLWPESRTIPLQPIEAWTYAARDGLEIPSYITWPAAGAGPQTPLIVMPHGGPELRDQIGFDQTVQYLTQLGYAVFQPNFRGSWGYGRAFVEAGHGQFGRAMQTDIDDGVDQLIAAGRVDPDRICVMGFSYGGYAAAMAVLTSPERYRCAVSGGGVYDLPGMIEHSDRIGDSVGAYWREFIGNPDDPESLAHLQSVSPEFRASEVTRPILIYHGHDDQIVPLRQARGFARALDRADIPHVLIVDDHVGHNWGRNEHTHRRILRNIRDFLADAMDGSLDSFEPDDSPDPDDD